MNVSKEELNEFAKQFVAQLPSEAGEHAYAVGLRGDLGAGKTAFVQEVAHVLGVRENVSSPTFVIAQVYTTAHPLFTTLVHIDAYRLSSEESDTIGFVDHYRSPHTLMLIEWPDNLPDTLTVKQEMPILNFRTIDSTTRDISYA
ncbi:MAG: tRNA (adenosine(37)-N6)-threonylcarbamoyltransferase complex ATPase subunit type 1 TsaE [Patescibacteria group bacterium UBA2163]